MCSAPAFDAKDDDDDFEISEDDDVIDGVKPEEPEKKGKGRNRAGPRLNALDVPMVSAWVFDGFSNRQQEFQVDDGVPRSYFWACTRFAVLKGLRFGSLMCNWDQIKLDRCIPIPSYAAFCGIFSSFRLYTQETPPEFELRDYKLSNLITPDDLHAAAISRNRKFSEIRYLSDPEELQRWCSFELLYKNNPRLFGCSQCYHVERCEVKLVSAIWARFEESPRKVPHARFKLKIWISTLHWNGSQFNSGDSEDSLIGKFKSKALRQKLSDDEQASFELRFSKLVASARESCLPRMEIKNQKKRVLPNACVRRLKNS